MKHMDSINYRILSLETTDTISRKRICMIQTKQQDTQSRKKNICTL